MNGQTSYCKKNVEEVAGLIAFDIWDVPHLSHGNVKRIYRRYYRMKLYICFRSVLACLRSELILLCSKLTERHLKVTKISYMSCDTLNQSKNTGNN